MSTYRQLPPKIYAAVNRCIYCRTTEGELSNEHILMFGLGGKDILPKASCNACARITSQLEQFVARDMWGAFRAFARMESRSKKNRPTDYPLFFQSSDGGRRKIAVPIDQFPASLALPVLQVPAFISGQRHETCSAWCMIYNPDELKQWSGQSMFLPPINVPLFSRFLAKTAHAYAIAELGIGTFTPLLPEVILERHDRPVDFVGCFREPPDETLPHRVQMMYIMLNEVKLVCVQIRLFAKLGAPEYVVVVGTPFS